MMEFLIDLHLFISILESRNLSTLAEVSVPFPPTNKCECNHIPQSGAAFIIPTILDTHTYAGRFLVMHTNDTPHLNHDISLKTGGWLKDGWSYLMPSDENILYEEVASAFADEHDKHVLEQVHALRKLYLVDSRNGTLLERKGSSVTDTEGDNNINNGNGSEATTKAEMNNSEMIFVVKRGSQVTGCITFDENKAELSDLAIRPSVRNGTVGKDLIQAVKDYAIKTSKTELVARTSEENRHWFEGHEFVSVDSDDDVCVYKLCLAKL